MKKHLCFIYILVGLSYSHLIAQDTKVDSTKTETKKPNSATKIKEFSYSYGYIFAEDMLNNDIFKTAELVEKEVLKGLKAGLNVDSTSLAATNAYLEKRMNQGEVSPTAEEGKLTAYHLGFNGVGNMINLLELAPSDFHYPSIKKGYTDYTKKKKARFSTEDMESKLIAYFQENQVILQEKNKAKREIEAAQNLAIGQKFLEQNAKKEGIKTTSSGLQYQIIKEGTGAKPTLENSVVTHYTATFINDKVFESSIELGQPATFSLKNIIPGWQEGILLMSVGSRYRFFIPAHLAYGQNSPPSIPPNSTLIFDIELLDVKIINDEEVGKSKMSYSYGYMVGRSLANIDLSLEEKNPSQFIQGFMKGFEFSKEEVVSIENYLHARIQSDEESKDEMTAKKIAFGIGITSSSGLATQVGAGLVDFDINGLGFGYSTAIQGKASMIEEEEMNSLLRAYFEPLQQKMVAELQKKAALDAVANIALGEKFLEENSKKEGVIVMSNGMQYIIIKEGEGKKPSIKNEVSTHYVGTLLDGSVFDSSIERGEPAVFSLEQVIEGWQEGIPLMPVGSKYKFFIPSNLAYGNEAIDDAIPAGSLLIFEVELLEIK